MAQFDVYRNRHAETRTLFPLLLDVQTSLLDQLESRWVIPLTKSRAFMRDTLQHVTPIVDFEDSKYLILTPQLAAIRSKDLGAVAGSLVQHRDAIVASMDFMISGF